MHLSISYSRCQKEEEKKSGVVYHAAKRGQCPGNLGEPLAWGTGERAATPLTHPLPIITYAVHASSQLGGVPDP